LEISLYSPWKESPAIRAFALFLSICIQKVTKTAGFSSGKQFSIFVTIINGKQTTHKQLILYSGISLPPGGVYAINSAVKVRKQPLHFLLQLVVYSAALTFVVAL
jgi:hypothetical protein